VIVPYTDMPLDLCAVLCGFVCMRVCVVCQGAEETFTVVEAGSMPPPERAFWEKTFKGACAAMRRTGRIYPIILSHPAGAPFFVLLCEDLPLRLILPPTHPPSHPGAGVSAADLGRPLAELVKQMEKADASASDDDNADDTLLGLEDIVRDAASSAVG
jgi:hypothetical protein